MARSFGVQLNQQQTSLGIVTSINLESLDGASPQCHSASLLAVVASVASAARRYDHHPAAAPPAAAPPAAAPPAAAPPAAAPSPPSPAPPAPAPAPHLVLMSPMMRIPMIKTLNLR
eukprot:TRINITY_DN15472_c0_g1_i2.p1 TRINITY_DN15472_c0_g1~~TRINITY_DN15472_c0_g1_i2.p1  ORF type:complete len:116 (-),score=50.59 TRINITY_DN15472_c0_g1_i2:242-589(-)